MNASLPGFNREPFAISVWILLIGSGLTAVSEAPGGGISWGEIASLLLLAIVAAWFSFAPTEGVAGFFAFAAASGAATSYLALRTYRLVLAAEGPVKAEGPELWHDATVHGLLLILVIGCATVEYRRGALFSLPAVALPLAVGSLALRATSPLALPLPVRHAAAWLLVAWGAAAVIAFSVRRSRRGSLPRRQLGRYVLEERIGGGGMGEVFHARHMDLGREAAVKVLEPKYARGSNTSETSPTALLAREALVTASLRSPHTVELYDFGIAADGTVYYVMEYLEGINLQQLVEKFGPQPAGRVVKILLQACESLAEAHRANLVHRDIKPANVVLCRLASSKDFIKVVDFGLTRVSTAVDSGKKFANGTPAYMAPEIASGEDGIDGRADTYSLGCVAYWLLTGSQVFDAENAVEAIVDHVKSAPTPPTRKSENPIPEDLEGIVMRCLEKRPRDRFESASALAEALSGCTVADSWSAENAEEWWDLHFSAQEDRGVDALADKIAVVDGDVAGEDGHLER